MAYEKSQPTEGDDGAPTPVLRSAFYVDGFNLFHALEDYLEPHLKWLDLWKLAELVIPSQTETVVKIVYCTAFYPGNSEKRWRHDQYLNALRIRGVDCQLGHFIREPVLCKTCSRGWDKYTEKEGDLNLALHLMNDAWLNLYDKAYLVTADSDQAATARLFAKQFPDKGLITVSPPGRNFSHHIEKHASGRLSLQKSQIERSLFPSVVLDKNGKHGRRPREWDPPIGWAPSLG